MRNQLQPNPNYPLNMICLLHVRYANGQVYTGTGFFVGPNDILTASHMVYDPNLGTAVQVTAYAGYGNRSQGKRYEISTFNYEKVGNADGKTINRADAHNDIALLTTTRKTTEWFGLTNMYDTSSTIDNVYQSGYEGSLASLNGDRSIQGLSTGSTRKLSQALWDNSNLAVSYGDSGSPLWIDAGNGKQAIGVVSTLGWSAALDAPMLDKVSGWMSANDDWKFGVHIGTSGADIIMESKLPLKSGTEPSTRDWKICEVYGGTGLDTLVANYPHRFYETHGSWESGRVRWPDMYPSVEALGQDGIKLSFIDQFYVLHSVERVRFAKGVMLALDEAPVQLFRLYQTLFKTEPDKAVMGRWVHQLDGGTSVADIVDGFTDQPEFSGMYGMASSGPARIIGFATHAVTASPENRFDMYGWLQERQAILQAEPKLSALVERTDILIETIGQMVLPDVWYTPFTA